MKKTIKGKQLNTDTAQMIGTVMVDEVKDIVETLYRNKAGVYFIHNVYAKSKSIDGKLIVGEDLHILTYDEAKEWGDKYLTQMEHMEYFEVQEESEELKTITVQIPLSVYNKLKIEKDMTRKTYGVIIAEALDDFLI